MKHQWKKKYIFDFDFDFNVLLYGHHRAKEKWSDSEALKLWSVFVWQYNLSSLTKWPIVLKPFLLSSFSIHEVFLSLKQKRNFIFKARLVWRWYICWDIIFVLCSLNLSKLEPYQSYKCQTQPKPKPNRPFPISTRISAKSKLSTI